MTKISYSKLIRVLAQSDDERRGDRRRTDIPGFPNGVERRVEDRRRDDRPSETPEELLKRHEKIVKNIPHHVYEIDPQAFKEMTFHKIAPGSFYAKVLNKATEQYIEFGKFVIAGFTALNKHIDYYNHVHGTNYPLLSENIPYHIEHKNIIPANPSSEQFGLFIALFNKAKICSKNEAASFAHDNEVDHAEAVYVENKSSHVFMFARQARIRAFIIRTAKTKLNK